MNLFAEMEMEIRSALTALQGQGKLADGLDMTRLTVEPPRDASHGDMATNAAMVLAKAAQMKPRDLAELLVEEVLKSDLIEAAEIAGPGFVNLQLDKAAWHRLVPHILHSGKAYGDGESGDKVNVEYVSANPTGPMHVGHARGAVVGDVLARLLEKTGSDVAREYYINDAGAQVDVLAQSALLRMREAKGETIGEIPDGLYPGDYLVPVGENLATMDVPKEEAEALTMAKSVALPMMMDMIREDLEALGVVHDFFRSEQALHDDASVDKALDELTSKDLIYQGVLEPPKGKEPPPDWEPSPQTLFKSTEFGDDSDRALKKSDGSWTYFAPDIAYHFDKYQRGYAKMIDVWGADHIGYIKRMQSAVNAITDGEAQLEVKICNLVKLMRGGEPVKMSKRSGSFITLREVVDEVGKDAVRFMMLTRKSDAPLDFDFDLVKDKSRDNPVFYVQYAHARIFSVMKNARELGWQVDDADLATVPLDALEHEAELALVRLLGTYPRMLAAAAQAREPHRVAFYLMDLAAAFHGLWNLGKEELDLRFIQEDDVAGSMARLALIRATALTLRSGFDVIGVTPQDELR
ncbi:MAG: Arginine--tRNA ligase [Alphaproteobacteria bacterium]|nr:MAG: Arginine--tRNA ligase [Alphaproteobacteria bacterium]